MKRHFIFVLAVFTVLLSAALGETRSDSFMSPMGPIADEQKWHLLRVTLLTLVAVIPVFVLLPYILWKYRRGRGGDSGTGAYRPKWEHSVKLDLLMWGVPIVLVAVMSYQLWFSTYRLDPYHHISDRQ